MDLLREKCRQHDLRITPQRIAIYEEVRKLKKHPNADAVFKNIRKRFPHISFDTVNRTLNTFSRIGILSVVEGYGEPKRYDPDIENHHHFRCVRCGDITDFHHKLYDDLDVPGDIGERFLVLGKKVVLEGLCGTCRRER